VATVFDPPQRRDALGHVVQLDLDVEGEHPVQGLLLASGATAQEITPMLLGQMGACSAL